MFGRFLIDEGVEVELPMDLSKAVDMLDKEVRNFAYDGYIYKLGGYAGTMHSQWKMSVQATDKATNWELPSPIGYVHVGKDENTSTTLLKIPPRLEWHRDRQDLSDLEAKLFTSFIFQLLNMLQDKKLIDLPGKLPMV